MHMTTAKAKRIIARGKKKPSKYIFTRIVVNGRKVVMRRRTRAHDAALRKAGVIA